MISCIYEHLHDRYQVEGRPLLRPVNRPEGDMHGKLKRVSIALRLMNLFGQQRLIN